MLQRLDPLAPTRGRRGQGPSRGAGSSAGHAIAPTSSGRATETHEPLDAFCGEIFASLARTDQRRSAHAYVHGLIHAAGRRSTRRIALETAVDRSDQSLQHFVNQSPWDHRPIRHRIAHRVCDAITEWPGPNGPDVPHGGAPGEIPVVWLLDEVAFTKSGRHSAAVAPQFAPSLGRVANIQFAATLMLAGRLAAVPVDWRLHLPPSWDADLGRRRRSHVPDHVRHQPFWHSLVDMVDELTVRWGMSAAPVCADLSGHPGADLFVDAMLDRDMDILVRVPTRHPVRLEPGHRRGAGLLNGGPTDELAALTVARDRRTVRWEQGSRQCVPRSQFVTVAVTVGQDPPRRMLALVEWPYGADRPIGVWLTTLVRWPAQTLVQVAKLGWQSRRTLQEMNENFGLCDYEGRSFRGWHHHVTLASAAYAFQVTRTALAE